MGVRIVTGDVRERLRGLADNSVHACITSPPYWGLRSYIAEGDPLKPLEIGLEQTYSEYIEKMVAVFREVRRVLRADGTVFLNLGDSYFNSGQGPQGKTGQRATRLSPSAGVRRAAACDTGGKAPGDYPAHDCLCRSLCDACRAAYRIGKAHSGLSRASTPLVSNSVSSPARTESQCARLPTSDLAPQGDRTAVAILDRPPALHRECARPLASLASTTFESSRPHQEASRQSGQPSECQLCGRSLLDCVPASVHMAACTCDTEGDASADRKIDRDVSGSAYRDYTTASLKPKDLVGIPWRVAFALQADGWWLRQDIIWSKPNPMPESVTDRCTKAHEYLFLMSKSERYYYDAEAISEDVKPWNDGKIIGYDGSQKNCETIGDPRFATRITSDRVVGSKRNRRSVWEVATRPFSEAHFATFPPALIEPCILAGCPKFTCSECGTALDNHIKDAMRSSTNGNDLRSLSDAVSQVAVKTAKNEVLQSEMRERSKKTCSAISAMPVVRETGDAGSPEESAEFLQQDLRISLDGEEQKNHQGPLCHIERLCGDLSARPSERIEGGLCDGTSARDGGAPEAPAAAVRDRASQRRRSGAQRRRQSRSDDKGEPRQVAEGTDRKDSLSALRTVDPSVPACPCCGANLTRIGAIVPGVVLDCFGGAGTTGLVADRLQRDAILIELNPEYAAMARRRIDGDAPLFSAAE